MAPIPVIKKPSLIKIFRIRGKLAPMLCNVFMSLRFSIINIVKAPIILNVAITKIKAKIIKVASFSVSKTLNKESFN